MSFDSIAKALSSGLSQFSFADFVDIAIIAIIVYKLIVLTKETRAFQVIKGVAILFIAAGVSNILGLTTLKWILDSVLASGIVVIVVLFQPECRRVLEKLGRVNTIYKATSNTEAIDEIQRAVLSLAKRRVGALIVFEQRGGLSDIIATGTKINGAISAPLIENIFEPNTPLHDGAMIIKDGTIVAASCVLPLSDDMSIGRELGTRHRAGLGISSVSDSITIIVSEETGIISIAKDGKLMRYVDAKALRDLLESIFISDNESNVFGFKFKNKKEQK